MKTTPIDPDIRKAVCRGAKQCIHPPHIRIKKVEEPNKGGPFYLKTSDEVPTYVVSELRRIGYRIGAVSVYSSYTLVHFRER